MIAAVNVLILGLLAGNVLFTFFRPRQGVAFYLLMALVAPHLQLGGTAVSYEILGFLPVGGVAFYRNGFRAELKAEHWLWIVYLILAIAATLLSVMRFGASVRWIAILGWGRAFFLFVLICTLLNRKSIFRVLSAAVVINLVVAAAQLFVSGAIEVTHALYAKESQTVLSRYLERGVIPRAPGTLGSPVNLGSLSLLTFAVAYERILRVGYQRLTTFIALAAVMAGGLAISKTAILGIPLILVMGMVLRFGQKIVSGFRIVPRRLARATTVAAAGGVGIWYLVRVLNEAGFGILYYLGFVLNPLKAFETRYGGDDAGLNKTIEVAMENWLTGVGFTSPYGEFIGDSTYVLAAHNSGVTSIFIILILYISSTRKGFYYGGASMLLPLAALFMTGVALPTLFKIEGALIIGYVIYHKKIG